MNPQLGFDQAPPISVPLRFFLAAPLFMVAAGVLTLVAGDSLLLSRWSPATLAWVHLLTAGFMLQTMLGALFQFVPVAVGVRLGSPQRLAGVVHVATLSGAALLAAHFLGAGVVAGWIALTALVGGLLVFVIPLGVALWPERSTSPTATAIKLALAALAVTAGLGAWLLASRLGADGLPVAMTDLHAGWGLVGWSGVLIAGVAYVVVPMFQITPAYPALFTRWYAPAVMALLMGWSASVALDWMPGSLSATAALALLAAAFAVLTLRLQAASRRPRPDTTVFYWRFGLGAMGLACVVLPAGLAGFGADRLSLLLGVLLLPGFFGSLISGMLYKIVPFLCWLHAQQHARATGRRAPHMGIFLADAAMRRQFWLHAAACLTLAAAALSDQVPVFIGGALLSASALGLWWNLLRAVGRYRRSINASGG